MGINSRVVTLALLTLVIAVGLSFIAGAWAGVGLTLAALSSTALWEITRERQKQNAVEAKRRETALTTFAPTATVVSADVEALVEGGAAWYLRPEAEVVAFWPRPELDELRQWCVNGGHLAVRLVSGDGGAGKTRLAVQLSRDLAEDGWRTMWVPPGREAAAVDAVRDIGEPAVLIVDYAETRPGLAGLLAEAIAAVDGPDLRVVLLARSAGEWWQQLLSGAEYELSRVLETAAPIVLGPLSTAGGQQSVFDEAVTAFADRLGVSRPDATLGLTDPAAIVLVVHAAALLAVLDHASTDGGSGRPQTASEILAGLLAHEARYWHKSAEARGLVVDPSVERLAVALGCLIGADNGTDAIGMLARVPDLADSAERRGQVARWLHDLYPAGESGEWLGLLRPDLIAEELVSRELTERPDLIGGLFAGLDNNRAGRALTVLARAALTREQVVPLLRIALSSDLKGLIIPALAVAVETNAVVGSVLSEVLAAAELNEDALRQIAVRIPYPSLALAGTAALVFRRLADESSEPDQRGRWLVDLSRWLDALGRSDEALAAIQEAVAIYRALAADHSDYLPALAMSLNNEASGLAAVGRSDKALAAIQEAVAIYGALAADHPDAYLPALAMALNNQAAHLAKMGLRDKALAAVKEAVAINRALAADHPDYLPNLAMSLNNEASGLAAVRRSDEALAAIQEAVAIYRAVAADHPDAYLPELAMSLNNASNGLVAVGNLDEALTAIEEAVRIRRRLAADYPDAYLPALAMSLNNQCACLTAVERSDEALTAIEEAVRIRRRLAAAYLPDLALSLKNQASGLARVSRLDEAVTAIEEAVRIRRRLAADYPDAYLPALAESLDDLALYLSVQGRDAESKAARDEAKAIRRES